MCNQIYYNYHVIKWKYNIVLVSLLKGHNFIIIIWLKMSQQCKAGREWVHKPPHTTNP